MSSLSLLHRWQPILISIFELVDQVWQVQARLLEGLKKFHKGEKGLTRMIFIRGELMKMQLVPLMMARILMSLTLTRNRMMNPWMSSTISRILTLSRIDLLRKLKIRLRGQRILSFKSLKSEMKE